MKVVLFGATGNVGKVLLKELNERGYEVTAVIREKSKFSGAATQIVVGDIKIYE